MKHPLHLLHIPKFQIMKIREEEIIWEDGEGYCDVEDDLSVCECDELEGNLCRCERHYVFGELLFNGGPCVVFKTY